MKRRIGRGGIGVYSKDDFMVSHFQMEDEFFQVMEKLISGVFCVAFLFVSSVLLAYYRIISNLLEHGRMRSVGSDNCEVFMIF